MWGLPREMLVKTTRDFWPPLSLQMGCRWWCPDSPNLPSCCLICSGFSPACTHQHARSEQPCDGSAHRSAQLLGTTCSRSCYTNSS